jgi:hypothetical protein
VADLSIRKNCTPEVWTLLKEAMMFYHNHDAGQGPCMKCLAEGRPKKRQRNLESNHDLRGSGHQN